MRGARPALAVLALSLCACTSDGSNEPTAREGSTAATTGEPPAAASVHGDSVSETDATAAVQVALQDARVGWLLVVMTGVGTCACSSGAAPAERRANIPPTEQAGAAACDATRSGGVVTRACADLIVFMNPVAPQGEVDAVAAALASDPAVVAVTYADHQEAFAEFTALVSDEPHENLGPGNIEPSDLPTSYRLRLVDTADPTAERARYKALPGVKEVTFD